MNDSEAANPVGKQCAYIDCASPSDASKQLGLQPDSSGFITCPFVNNSTVITNSIWNDVPTTFNNVGVCVNSGSCVFSSIKDFFTSKRDDAVQVDYFVSKEKVPGIGKYVFLSQPTE